MSSRRGARSRGSCTVAASVPASGQPQRLNDVGRADAVQRRLLLVENELESRMRDLGQVIDVNDARLAGKARLEQLRTRDDLIVGRAGGTAHLGHQGL